MFIFFVQFINIINETLKTIYASIKKNGFLDKNVIFPTTAAITAHTIALLPIDGDWNNMLYVQIPEIDYLTHFIGGYAVSQIADTFYESKASILSKHNQLTKISKNAFVLGAVIFAGSLNEVFERTATTQVVQETLLPYVNEELLYAVKNICSETTPNTIKDLLVNTCRLYCAKICKQYNLILEYRKQILITKYNINKTIKR
ncbi:MAG: hypothetical protein KAI53_00380 [Candidatus Aenigmarchaeota archaeon]|nr:hypothetical protein [Candidatus Aenigmarchaeota archaeon]